MKGWFVSSKSGERVSESEGELLRGLRDIISRDVRMSYNSLLLQLSVLSAV